MCKNILVLVTRQNIVLHKANFIYRINRESHLSKFGVCKSHIWTNIDRRNTYCIWDIYCMNIDIVFSWPKEYVYCISHCICIWYIMMGNSASGTYFYMFYIIRPQNYKYTCATKLHNTFYRNASVLYIISGWRMWAARILCPCDPRLHQRWHAVGQQVSYIPWLFRHLLCSIAGIPNQTTWGGGGVKILEVWVTKCV